MEALLKNQHTDDESAYLTTEENGTPPPMNSKVISMTAGLQVPTPIANLVQEEKRENEWENEQMEAELVQVAQGKLKQVQKRVMEGLQDEPVAPYQALPASLKHFASAEPIVEPSERAPQVRTGSKSCAVEGT